MKVDLGTFLLIEAVIGVVLFMGYTIWKMLIKNEQLEKRILEYENYVNNVSAVIEQSTSELEEIDKKGIFESDDEIGWFFTYIKNLQNSLNQFKINRNE